MRRGIVRLTGVVDATKRCALKLAVHLDRRARAAHGRGVGHGTLGGVLFAQKLQATGTKPNARAYQVARAQATDRQ